jgi:SAM-dependent methyltransferase
MHASVLAWIRTAVTAADVAGRRVLEVGAFNVNGSVRPIVEAHRPAVYLGVDQTPGPGVDQVVACDELVATFGPGSWDVVISTEMLEHVQDWQGSVAALCDVLAPGGLLLVTTRSPGFPYHPYPIDKWRYTPFVLAHLLLKARLALRMLIPDTDRRSPGVFAIASKPRGWVAPWAGCPLADVFAGVDVREMVAP